RPAHRPRRAGPRGDRAGRGRLRGGPPRRVRRCGSRAGARGVLRPRRRHDCRPAAPRADAGADAPPMTCAFLSASVPATLRAAGALVLVFLACAGWYAGTVRAQGAPTFEWELLGLEDEPLTSMFFAPGPADDG